MQSEIIIVPAVFYCIYMVVRALTDYLLKRRIIRSGHFDRADILSQGLIISSEAETMPETNNYPSLKWGLVAFMGGAGFVLIDILRRAQLIDTDYHSVLPIGIELMFISAGFLLYFMIANYKSKTK
jgi:hypothetical protein